MQCRRRTLSSVSCRPSVAIALTKSINSMTVEYVENSSTLSEKTQWLQKRISKMLNWDLEYLNMHGRRTWLKHNKNLKFHLLGVLLGLSICSACHAKVYSCLDISMVTKFCSNSVNERMIWHWKKKRVVTESARAWGPTGWYQQHQTRDFLTLKYTDDVKKKVLSGSRMQSWSSA